MSNIDMTLPPSDVPYPGSDALETVNQLLVESARHLRTNVHSAAAKDLRQARVAAIEARTGGASIPAALMSEIRLGLAECYCAMGDLDASRAELHPLIDELRAVAEPDRTMLFRALNLSALAAARTSDFEEAEQAWTEAAQLGRTLTSPPLIPERDLAASIHGLARIHAMQQRWPEAADLLEEAVKLLEHDEAAIGSGELIDALNLLATAHSFMARPTQAGETAARAAELASRRAERGGVNERTHAAHVLNNMARISLEAGRVAEAHAALSKCVVECRALLDHGANPMLRNLLAASLNRLGHCCLKLGRQDEAIGHLDASVTIMRDLVEREGHAEMAEDLATAIADLERIKGDATRF